MNKARVEVAIAMLAHILIIFALSACTSIDRQIFSREYAANPVPPEQVRTFTHEDDVSQCRKVAYLKAEGEQPEEKMLYKLRKAAGKLGANTLLLIGFKRTTFQEVMEGVPEAAVAGALGINAATPPAQTGEAVAYYCEDSD
ncbi:MAG: hypothetical protein AMJ53_05915 [Gammaproteobacteria bacterium SG8_11]|nr:MAG: hypothetical protein AMJ53_05915 [Gammaproteobacteria bacterium SG8_11]